MNKIATFDFNSLGKTYDIYRPGYPKELIEMVLQRTNFKDGRALEVGSGTGQATSVFAETGISIDCIEPAVSFVEKARQKLKNFSNVNIINSTLEKFETEKTYQLIYGAHSLHWIDKEVRFRKIHSLLKSNGCLVVISNVLKNDFDFTEEESKIWSRVFGPSNTGRHNTLYEISAKNEIDELENCEFISRVEMVEVANPKKFDFESYVGYQNTITHIARMPNEKKHELFLGIQDIFIHMEGIITYPFTSVAFIAYKK
jgi:SAM-dependent methyltransferase